MMDEDLTPGVPSRPDPGRPETLGGTRDPRQEEVDLEELDAQIAKRFLVIEVPDDGPPTSNAAESFAGYEVAGLSKWLEMLGVAMIEEDEPDEE